jgi:hypothetical protein
VPKGLPEAAGTKRLAVEVEDHDLAFGEFEGEIPSGQYGGTVAIWDRGQLRATRMGGGPDRVRAFTRLLGLHEMRSAGRDSRARRASPGIRGCAPLAH